MKFSKDKEGNTATKSQVKGYCTEIAPIIQICGIFYPEKGTIGKNLRKSISQNEIPALKYP